jgi:hypothetical protein
MASRMSYPGPGHALAGRPQHRSIAAPTAAETRGAGCASTVEVVEAVTAVTAVEAAPTAVEAASTVEVVEAVTAVEAAPTAVAAAPTAAVPVAAADAKAAAEEAKCTLPKDRVLRNIVFVASEVSSPSQPRVGCAIDR